MHFLEALPSISPISKACHVFICTNVHNFHGMFGLHEGTLSVNLCVHRYLLCADECAPFAARAISHKTTNYYNSTDHRATDKHLRQFDVCPRELQLCRQMCTCLQVENKWMNDA